ncbi:COP9 signalosome complex subunit 9, partial [Contarinia nasturtii]|uniref:COP9 signalosome complex subunit 9 n=1 Tax=Contarinia nasturtii TaxID=265458 RepID=UPI0012D3B132
YSSFSSSTSRSLGGVYIYLRLHESKNKMKPTIVADEMFPEHGGPFMELDEAGGSSGLLMDLAANEKDVHADFFNDFEDLCDEEEETSASS